MSTTESQNNLIETEKENKSGIELPSFLDGTFLTILGILFPLLSLVKAISFYNAFGIPITDYISFNEIITLFINDIFLYFIVFSGIVYIEYLGHKFRNSDSKAKDFINKHIGTFILYVVLAIVFFFIYSKIPFIRNSDGYKKLKEMVSIKSTHQNLFYVYFGGGILFYTLTGIFVSAKKSFSNLQTAFFKLLVLFLLALIHGRFEAFKFYSKDPLKYVESIYKKDNNSIKISKDTLFLGRTKDFIFLFSTTEKKSFVINNEDVSTIHFRKPFKTGPRLFIFDSSVNVPNFDSVNINFEKSFQN